MNTLLSKAIKPEQCTIIFGIPITNAWNHEAAIERCQGDSRRFINQTRTGRPFGRDEYQFIIPEDRIKYLERLGANLIKNATISHFSSLLLQPNPVLILFTHWHDNAVEFIDGFIDTNDLVDLVPVRGPETIFDLSICKPNNLALAIKNKRNDCYVRSSSAKVDVRKWLDILIILFRILKESNSTYPEAWEAVAEMVNQAIGKIK